MKKEEKMKNYHSYSLAALVVGLLCISPVLDTHASAADRGSCSKDIAKFCKDVKPGGGRILDCLKQHEKDLSAACKEQVTKREEKAEKSGELSQACKGDVDKLCKDVKLGGGRILKCLKENESKLSAQCKATLAKTKEVKVRKK
jgi:hypothetical protein